MTFRFCGTPIGRLRPLIRLVAVFTLCLPSFASALPTVLDALSHMPASDLEETLFVDNRGLFVGDPPIEYPYAFTVGVSPPTDWIQCTEFTAPYDLAITKLYFYGNNRRENRQWFVYEMTESHPRRPDDNRIIAQGEYSAGEGWKTIVLDAPIPRDSGQDFAVGVRYHRPDGHDATGNGDRGMNTREGAHYQAAGGSWTNIRDRFPSCPHNFTIRAIVQPEGVGHPAPTLDSIFPAGAARLDELDVNLSGSGFIDGIGISRVDFGPDIYIRSTEIVSGNRIVARILVEAGATLGPRDVTVHNPGPGGGTARLRNAFTVATAGVAETPAIPGYPAVRISPNPARAGRALITVSGLTGPVFRVSIYDAQGRRLLTRAPNPTIENPMFEIDLRSLPSGCYLVRLDAAEQSFYRKLVVNQ